MEYQNCDIKFIQNFRWRHPLSTAVPSLKGLTETSGTNLSGYIVISFLIPCFRRKVIHSSKNTRQDLNRELYHILLIVGRLPSEGLAVQPTLRILIKLFNLQGVEIASEWKDEALGTHVLLFGSLHTAVENAELFVGGGHVKPRSLPHGLGKCSWGVPGGSVGKESDCQCRRYGFNPRSLKIPRALEQLSPWATTTALCSRARVPHGRRLRRRSKPSDGESACTATKTQHSQKCKKLYACIWKRFFQDCPKYLEALLVSRSRGSGAGWHLMRSQGFHSTSYSAEDSPLDEGFPAGLGDEPSWVSTWLGSRALSLTQTLGVAMEVFCRCG